PDRARRAFRTEGTPASRAHRGPAAGRAGEGRSLLFLPAVGLRASLFVIGRGSAPACAVRRVLCGLAAAGAKAGVGRQRMAAVRARDDSLFADGSSAVRAEVRAPDDRRTALAAARGRPPACCRRREHRVELVESRLEIGDVTGVLAEQVLPELLPAVHLHRKPAKIAEQLLASLQDGTPLSPKCAGRASAADRALRRSGRRGGALRGG